MWNRRRGALLLAAVAVCLVPAAASGADSPDKMLASILQAAHGEQSVHYQSTGNYGPEQVKFDAYAGANEGIQEISYRKGGKSGHLTVIVTGNTAYIRGDAFTLINYVGFKSTAALNYADQWVRFPHDDKGYGVIAAGVTLSSAIDELNLLGTLANIGQANVEGQQVFGVSATSTSAKGTTVAVVYARAAGAPLPVKETAKRGTINLTTTFSGWNDHVSISVPKSSTPIAVVRKTPSTPIA